MNGSSFDGPAGERRALPEPLASQFDDDGREFVLTAELVEPNSFG